MKRTELRLNKVQVSHLNRNVNTRAQNTSPGMKTCNKCDNPAGITTDIVDIITTITHISG